MTQCRWLEISYKELHWWRTFLCQTNKTVFSSKNEEKRPYNRKSSNPWFHIMNKEEENAITQITISELSEKKENSFF